MQTVPWDLVTPNELEGPCSGLTTACVSFHFILAETLKSQQQHAPRPSAQGGRKREAPRRTPRWTAVPARLTYAQSAARAVSAHEGATVHGVCECVQGGGAGQAPVSMNHASPRMRQAVSAPLLSTGKASAPPDTAPSFVFSLIVIRSALQPNPPTPSVIRPPFASVPPASARMC